MAINIIEDPAVTVVQPDLTEITVQTISTGIASDQLLLSLIGVSIQGYTDVLQNTDQSFTTALKAKLDGIEAGATADQNAAEVNYTNITSGLSATTSQGAIDEIDATVDSLGSGAISPTFDNTISGLAATTVKTAIDELAVIPTVTITTSSTVDMQNAVTFVNASTDITVTLPTAVGNAGKIRNIKRIDTSASSVILSAQTGELIDGVSSGNLNSMDNITVISDGSNWFIL